MASIVSSLSAENELKLHGLFSSRVCFHLVYKSSHHGADIGQLLDRFDKHGKYLLMVFPSTGFVRGAFMSKSLKYEKEYSDEEAFVFQLRDTYSDRFPELNCTRAITVSVGSFSISFEKHLSLTLDQDYWYCSEVFFRGIYQQKVDVQLCKDVELHRVQDLGDILPNPWREVVWHDTTRENLREDFASYKMLLESLPRVKALFLGPVGSGKSSFINSLRSTMYKRIVHLPHIGTSVEGFTQKVTTYGIRTKLRGPQSALSFCDVKAIGDDDSTGLSYTDALAVIKGHVPEGYKFQRGVTVTDAVSGYIANPTLNEQIHCVLFVLDASKVTSYPSSLQSTLRKLHSGISDLGIPQLILLTHVDQVCLAVQKDLKDVYSSQTVQDKMQKAAELVGLPLSYVLPVKNYFSELTVECNTDILLLSVGMSILQAVDDTFEDQYSNPVPQAVKEISSLGIVE
ncbi:interferon-induced protein 44-like [Ictalurus punctatus]|uniref:Interferon-induced protein 44-like n=1 Tax=Ictalurus punctatus TaxID=7998 RepID=A0A9F7TP59_ICTPU|nr:interferon-induced protein 44-like [Ictalurus punctatus]